jgi:beta-glucosidase
MKGQDKEQIYSAQECAEQLVSKMTLQEKMEQLRFDAPAIKRLKIPAYNWWNEALHGVARAGTATVFPQAIALAAMFDCELLERIGNIIATEGRAKYNASVCKGDRDIYKGLTFWAPNLNIFRDPRWGRGHETYGEDPFLTSRLGVAFIKGIQTSDGKYLKAAACAKHYAVHSGPEGERHCFNAQVSQKDLWETYLPAFEAAVKEAHVEGVMGAYNRVNGEACCGSATLLKKILREKWNFDGYTVSDCMAIEDFYKNHKITANQEESAALALKSGCDINCGIAYRSLPKAYEHGLVTDNDITTAAIHAFRTRFRLGMFDKSCSYNKIPYEVVDCDEHNQVSLEAARRSMVLLKNDGILPLKKEFLKTIAVIGPNANSEEILKGNYNGTASKPITILEGIHDYLAGSVRVLYSEGCHLFKDQVEALAASDDRISEAKTVAEHADVVLLCLGLDSRLEGEEGDAGNAYASGDKADLELPDSQKRLLHAMLETGKPVVLLVSTGSSVNLQEADKHCNAILQTWYPGSKGGKAVAEILFGDVCPSGRLPITFYKSAKDLPDFHNYAMEGRTYRYFMKEPLYPFGFGLSYANFSFENVACPSFVKDGKPLPITVTVSNKSAYAGDEIIQVYIQVKDSPYSPPNPHLSAFKRIHLECGETQTYQLTVSPHELEVVDLEGARIFDGTGYQVFVGSSQPDTVSIKRKGQKPIELWVDRKQF